MRTQTGSVTSPGWVSTRPCSPVTVRGDASSGAPPSLTWPQMVAPNSLIVCDRDMLRILPPSEVVIRPSGCALVKPRYYRLMDADAPVTVDAAGNMYETDEYELACLEQGRTPFTRKGVNSDAEQDNYAMVPEPETPPASQGKQKPGWGTARAVGTVRGLEFGK